MSTSLSSTEIILAEYEELVKAKEFYFEKKIMPFECTYQAIIKDLSNEYSNNLEQKLNRWIDITNARYFKKAAPVIFYFQVKMLYRDGYYEAAVSLARSICEMICIDLLMTQAHPFGNQNELELENFRTLVNFLGVPKKLPKTIFENEIVSKIQDLDSRNFIKSSYSYNKSTKEYNFKIAVGKKPETLNKFHNILNEIPYDLKENFPGQTFKTINSVYTDANAYVHARSRESIPRDEAKSIINKIGFVLAYIYNVTGDLVEKNIITGYKFFPDICQGHNFGLDVYTSPEAAQRGYYNLPSQKNVDDLLALSGIWIGKWKSDGMIKTLRIKFTSAGETFFAGLTSFENSEVNEHFIIKLFGSYFHLIYQKEKKIRFHFELEIIDHETLIGEDLNGHGKILFVREKN